MALDGIFGAHATKKGDGSQGIKDNYYKCGYPNFRDEFFLTLNF
jgi:hypothetical protein